MKNIPISIVVADDHPSVLHGVTDVLTSEPDMTVVAACSNGAAALKAIRELSPTVAVLDFLMPVLNGLDVLEAISADCSPTKVVLLTATASDRQLLTAVARGTKGVVLKEAAIPELVQCVRRVAAGELWLPAQVEAALARGARCQSVSRHISREQQIVLLVSDALSNKEIGRRLDLSEGTVKVHLHNIYGKLRVNNRTALTAMAITCREDLQHSAYAPRQGLHPLRQSTEKSPVLGF
jgi:two-component system, NarL family, nitrate/nitrite response regulator NarL